MATQPASAVASRRRPTTLRRPDLALAAPSLMLAAGGALVIYSATRGLGPTPDTSYVTRQILFAGLGVAAMVALAFIDYRRWRPIVPAVFAVSMAALIAVLTPLGREVNGTRGWFSVGGLRVQPAEFAKLAIILAIALIAHSARERLSGGQLIMAFGVAGVVVAAILAQPDAGTALVCGAITLAMVLVAGARPWHLLAVALISLAAATAILNSDTLETYQRERLTSFLSPADDGQGTAWNQRQAQVAIGHGGITGTGLFEGTQTKGSFVPEQQTDFVFTVVGEEFGFLGAATMLGLYALLLWRIWCAARSAHDGFGATIAVGVFAMLLSQMFQSVGMTMGLVPITGVPLPLVSYGGSSLLTTFAGVGLVLSVARHRDPLPPAG